jgi:hypothetical protein
MSSFLERFRALDTVKFTKTFGTDGTLTDKEGATMNISGIGRDPYAPATPMGQAFENDSPAVWFVTADLPTDDLIGCRWEVYGNPERLIESIEPNARTGMTRCSLSDL